MHIDLRAGHEFESHGADQDEIGACPKPLRGGILHDNNTVGRKIKSSPKRPFKVSAQRPHQFGLRPKLGGLGDGRLRAVECGKKIGRFGHLYRFHYKFKN